MKYLIVAISALVTVTFSTAITVTFGVPGTVVGILVCAGMGFLTGRALRESK